MATGIEYVLQNIIGFIGPNLKYADGNIVHMNIALYYAGIQPKNAQLIISVFVTIYADASMGTWYCQREKTRI